MRAKIGKWTIWILALSGTLISASIFALAVGSTSIPFTEIVEVIFKGKGTIGHSILFDLRLPRIVLGFAIGGGLSLAGVILQGMFRNPLVEPYTLGISGGAALGVCLNIVLRLPDKIGIISFPLFGFLGAILVITIIYLLSIKRGILRIPTLLLTGVMVSFIASSLIMLAMAITRTEDLHGIVFWIMGSLAEADWWLIKAMVLVSIISMVISYFFSLDLNALSLGEEEAMHLGLNIEKSKRLLFLISALLTGCSVSIGGIIGFVGLLVPHFMRMLVGSDHRILLIASFLGGGAFLILCDTLARTIISPLELPVGVITGIIGGILFIYALTKKEMMFWGK